MFGVRLLIQFKSLLCKIQCLDSSKKNTLKQIEKNQDNFTVLNSYERGLPKYNLAYEDKENVLLIIYSFRSAAENRLGDEFGNDIGTGIITTPNPQPVPYGWGNCMAKMEVELWLRVW